MQQFSKLEDLWRRGSAAALNGGGDSNGKLAPAPLPQAKQPRTAGKCEVDWDAAAARCTQVNDVVLGIPAGVACGVPAPEGLPRWLVRLPQIASETFLLARLTLKLCGYLGFGWRWAVSLLQLLAFAGFLMPGFLQMVAFYYLSPRVLRGVRYSPRSRNVLDVYLPPDHWSEDRPLCPVVIFITGGAWVIGYKAWGALLGRRLSKAGIIVCCLDYANFPQARCCEMLEDVNRGITWVLDSILYYRGDPGQVFLVGQSCGAHIASLALLTQAEQRAKGAALPGGLPAWDTRRLRAFIGVSGVYNVYDLEDHLDRRGLNRSILRSIMSVAGEPQLKLLSPCYLAAHVLGTGGRSSSASDHSEPATEAAAPVADPEHAVEEEEEEQQEVTCSRQLLPPTLLLHGTKDRCVPVAIAQQYAEALREGGVPVELKLYQGQSHTSPLLENPMRGGADDLADDILSVVLNQPVSSSHATMCPHFMVRLATWVCPF